MATEQAMWHQAAPFSELENLNVCFCYIVSIKGSLRFTDIHGCKTRKSRY